MAKEAWVVCLAEVADCGVNVYVSVGMLACWHVDIPMRPMKKVSVRDARGSAAKAKSAGQAIEAMRRPRASLENT